MMKSMQRRMDKTMMACFNDVSNFIQGSSSAKTIYKLKLKLQLDGR